ncbi:hypothetical protein CDAR_575061 [Caerostris darwini]|uniref:Uncharacterized protein n=1 Tax=Caerostris darwini TaxID=1538125 RepID=A0AAV4T1L4_9ARAC|nr:hypothetical protein CDAR_575061 [Caerostris darwini]
MLREISEILPLISFMAEGSKSLNRLVNGGFAEPSIILQRHAEGEWSQISKKKEPNGTQSKGGGWVDLRLIGKRSLHLSSTRIVVRMELRGPWSILSRGCEMHLSCRAITRVLGDH